MSETGTERPKSEAVLARTPPASGTDTALDAAQSSAVVAQTADCTTAGTTQTWRDTTTARCARRGAGRAFGQGGCQKRRTRAAIQTYYGRTFPQ